MKIGTLEMNVALTPSSSSSRLCSLASCSKPGATSGCSRCKLTVYCSRDCQKADWANHKVACGGASASTTTAPTPPPPSAAAATLRTPAAVTTATTAPPPPSKPSPVVVAAAAAANPYAEIEGSGYPNDPLVQVHDSSGFPVDCSKPRSTPKTPPCVFRLRSKDDRLTPDNKCAVDRGVFLSQFSSFTHHCFDGFKADDWSGVVCAGGAVLASLMPLESCWRSLRPSPIADESRDFVRRFHPNDPLSLKVSESFTPEGFLQQVRFKGSDVDIFLYGISDEKVAEKKVKQLLLLLTQAVLKSSNKEILGDKISYVKTPNTITIDFGHKDVRKVQIILRLYADKAEILNSFDLDSCCVCFDGDKVLATKRGVRALTHKVNIVDLSLRGGAYENRLIKYAARGFMIGVPGLEPSKVDSVNTNVAYKKTSWGGIDFTGDGFSYTKWEESGKKLLRILLMEQISVKMGYFDEPFPGRLKREPCEDMVRRYHRISTGDEYPSHHYVRDRGPLTDYAASNRVMDFFGPDAPRELRIRWEIGPMKRTPLSWPEWADGVYTDDIAAKKSKKTDYYEESRKKREATEAAAKDAAAASLKASLDEERAKVRAEAEFALEAEKLRAKWEARALQQSLSTARAEAQKAEERAAKAGKEARMAEAEAMEARKAAEKALSEDEGRLCVICFENEKTHVCKPCKHLCLCEGCVDLVEDGLCPICRASVVGTERIYSC